MIGRRLGRFLIVAPLGEGGMATVWRAEDELLHRPVAIKILHESLAHEEEPRLRFRREGEIAAGLDHPAIAPVFEAGEQDGISYLVMAYVDGRTLAETLDERLLPIPEALRVVIAVAEALQYAHDRPVFHRDVTSRNIMLARDGRVFVLDFGLALAGGRTRVTTSIRLRGTINYMAPEVLDQKEADARSDGYSLGVVLYEALTGSLPFRGTRVEEVSYAAHNLDYPVPSAVRPEVPAALDAIVLRAMARDPATRYVHLREMAGQLRQVLDPGSNAVGPAAPPVGDAEAQMAGGGSALAERSTRMASGAVPVYLALLPANPRPTEDEQRLTESLIANLGASITGLQRLHVVATGPPPPGGVGDGLRPWARQAGANLVVQLRVRIEGSAVRVTHSLHDPEAGVQISGGRVDCTTLRPLELEDLVVADVRRALGPIASLAEAARVRPGDPAAEERYAQALAYLERYDNEASLDGASTLLEGLIVRDGGSAPRWAMLGRVFLRKHSLTSEHVWESRAADACSRAAVLDAGAPETLLALGELHAAAGRNQVALEALERVPTSWVLAHEVALARAIVLDNLGRRSEGEALCRRVAAERPGDWRAHHTLGKLLIRHGDYEGAVAAWRQVTEMIPDNASAHRNMGSALQWLERYEEGVQAFRRSIEIRPNAAAFYNLGTALFLVRDFDAAIAIFEKAVALNPADPMAWGNLGNACLYAPGHEGRKREALEQAIGLMRARLEGGPGDATAWARLAGWYAGLDRHDEALTSIRTALRMSPDNVTVMVEAASVFAAQGSLGEALEQVRRAVGTGFSRVALRRRESLSPLRGNPEFESLLDNGDGSGSPTKQGGRT